MTTNLEQLPDEVLVQILSLLTVNEAGRTCVLSHRWRNLWKFITRLNFTGQTWKLGYWYVQWVDQILRLHQCSFIDEFELKFYLCACSSTNIDRWIVKLFRPKRVKKLEINLSEYCFCKGKIGISPKDNRLGFKCLSNLPTIDTLTSLTLRGSPIDGPLLEYLLTNCPHLESLSVSDSQNIRNLKVCGTSVQLKHLTISRCRGMNSIELSAPKLATFNYHFEQRIEFHIGINPKLCELIFGGGNEGQLSYALGPFSSLHSQLETLQLQMIFHGNNEIPQFLELKNLKTLILDVTVVDYTDSLIGFTSLIEAPPSLKRFKLSLHVMFAAKITAPEPLLRPHQCLKRVEIFGFAGGCPDLGLVRYLLKNAINLEKIVISPFHRLDDCKTPQEIAAEQKKVNARRKHARELNSFLPPGAELIVL